MYLQKYVYSEYNKNSNRCKVAVDANHQKLSLGTRLVGRNDKQSSPLSANNSKSGHTLDTAEWLLRKSRRTITFSTRFSRTSTCESDKATFCRCLYCSFKRKTSETALTCEKQLLRITSRSITYWYLSHFWQRSPQWINWNNAIR